MMIEISKFYILISVWMTLTFIEGQEPNTTEGQALLHSGGAEEGSHFCKGDRHLSLVYDGEEKEFKVIDV